VRAVADGPLRIVMVSEFAYPILGGISEHVHFLSRELAALGHDVVVLTSNTGDTRQHDLKLEAAGRTSSTHRGSRPRRYRSSRSGPPGRP
jgi:glycosyltransferase involved in cell wall biosynthesis